MTVGDIAKRTGHPQHRVTYAILRAGIMETDRAGIIRLYDEPTVQRIEMAMSQIDSRMGPRTNFIRAGVSA